MGKVRGFSSCSRSSQPGGLARRPLELGRLLYVGDVRDAVAGGFSAGDVSLLFVRAGADAGAMQMGVGCR